MRKTEQKLSRIDYQVVFYLQTVHVNTENTYPGSPSVSYKKQKYKARIQKSIFFNINSNKGTVTTYNIRIVYRKFTFSFKC